MVRRGQRSSSAKSGSGGSGVSGSGLHAVGAAPRPQTPPAEKRGINRVPVRVVVSEAGRSAVLGETRDLSLEGLFIDTDRPLDEGAVVPLALTLAGREVQLRAVVVRRTPRGMGLQFLDVAHPVQKTLKRFIAQATSVADARQAMLALHASDRTVEPIVDPKRLREILQRTQAAESPLTLIPSTRLVRDVGQLAGAADGRLTVRLQDQSLLEPGEEVFALATLDFVSHSFTARVETVDGVFVTLSVPTRIVYSERRNRLRETPPLKTVIRWPSPWDPDIWLEFPVRDLSRGGLSFRLEESSCQFVPGAPLVGAMLVSDGRPQHLRSAEIRHITREQNSTKTWLRVGVSYGAERGEPRTDVMDAPKSGVFGRIGERLHMLKTQASFFFHRWQGRRPNAGRLGDAARIEIRGQRYPIVGLLDTTYDTSEPVRCPLVLIVPGFGGRKEQMTFLAKTLVEGFRRENADIAVLRIDGTNNLGESGKDEGCEAEGKHTLHYTISGTVQDTLDALTWARANPHVDPSHIILTSFSMSSVAVRHVLAGDGCPDVGLWVNYMGAPDVRDAIKHVSGHHLDLFDRDFSQPLGVCSLVGCLTDGDAFYQDLVDMGIGQLDDARREMARIQADTLWLLGRHDAYMNPERVRDLMSIRSDARRDVIEVEGGHLPKTGDEAVRQFVSITRRVWQHVKRSPMRPFSPSVGKLAAAQTLEYEATRKAHRSMDRRAYWRDYLLGKGGAGFDILEHAPEYTDFMTLQATLADVAGQDVLEVGAGTGNLTYRLCAQGPKRLVSTDLVPEALGRIRAKLGSAGQDVELRQMDASGSPLLALRRWVAGDLAGPRALADRFEDMHAASLDRLLNPWDDAIHAALLGRDVDVDRLCDTRRLPANAARLLRDLHRLSRHVTGREPLDPSAPDLAVLSNATLNGATGIPDPDRSYDVVAMSLLLSYVDHPEDILWEAYRVLRPGGRLIVSSMRRDTDSSKLYLDLVERLERLPESELPEGMDRETLLAGLHTYADTAATLLRLEEEGTFRFYDPPELVDMVSRRGFVRAKVSFGWGDPAQAVAVLCYKP